MIEKKEKEKEKERRLRELEAEFDKKRQLKCMEIDRKLTSSGENKHKNIKNIQTKLAAISKRKTDVLNQVRAEQHR